MSEIWVSEITRCSEDNIRVAHGIMATHEIMPHWTALN
jgi:hypothetical protein